MTHTPVVQGGTGAGRGTVKGDPHLLAQVERRLADLEQRIANQTYLLRVLSDLGEPTLSASRALEAMQARHAQLFEEQQLLRTGSRQ